MEQGSFGQSQYPLYTLKPNITRIIVAKALIVVPLVIVLYVAAYLNFRFLGIAMNVFVNMGILVSMFLLAAFDLVMEYRKALRVEYYFYADRMYVGGNWIMYRDMGHIDAKRNFLDRMFQTCDLVIDQKTRMRHVPDSYNIYQYIQALLARSKGAQ